MRWWRHSPLGPIVAMILLLWTAVDLSNAGLCALDNEDAAPIAADATTALAASHGDRAPLAPDTSRHVDDCFCCSHCVDVRPFAAVLECAPVPLPRSVLMLAAPRNIGASLYHPPLAA